MAELHFPWIETAIILPLIVALGTYHRVLSRHQRIICGYTAAAVLLLCLGEWIDFSLMDTYEAHDHWDLFTWLFARELLVVDALSAPLLPLAALLYTTVFATTLKTKVDRFSFRSNLLGLSILLATLSSRDSWLVIVLLGLSCLPIVPEMIKRGRSVRTFVFHAALSLTLMLAGQGLLSMSNGNDLLYIIGGFSLTGGCLIRAGVFPMHCWIADLFEKATFGSGVLFLTPMIGCYAIMRLVFPIAPDYALQAIAILSLFTSIYAASISLIQTDMRRLFAYILISHSSLVLVGIELATPIGLAGGLLVWVSVVIALLGFAITIRSIEARFGRLSLQFFHGLYSHLPFLAGMTLITGLAAIGFPGTTGFIALEMLLEGVAEVYPAVGIVVAMTAALNGISVMRAYFHLFTGVKHSSTGSLSCVRVERLAILGILLLILGGGIFPQPGVSSRYEAAKDLMEHRSPTHSLPNQD